MALVRFRKQEVPGLFGLPFGQLSLSLALGSRAITGHKAQGKCNPAASQTVVQLEPCSTQDRHRIGRNSHYNSEIVLHTTKTIEN